MLHYLSIKNFALIDNCEVTFSPHLNIISGETGAGKSIIIQALSILLGSRASVEHIRTGKNEAILNATISIHEKDELKTHLAEQGIELEDNEIILRRILTREGKSKSFINGSPVTSKELSLFAAYLFDFHGQHDGVTLLRRQTHLAYLDNYLALTKEVQAVKNIYQKILNIEEELQLLNQDEQEKARKIELLEYQIEEIRSVAMKNGEDEELKKEITILENYEKLIQQFQELHDLFMQEQGILNQVKKARQVFQQVVEMDSSLNNQTNQMADIFYNLEEISSVINSRMSDQNFDVNQLDFLIERNEAIENLKRKYGNSFSEIVKFFNKAQKDLEFIQFSDEKKGQLQNELKKTKEIYLQQAVKLSNKRKQGALKLQEMVKGELINLAMEQVDFKIDINQMPGTDKYLEHQGEKIKYGLSGIDAVEFLISPNKGEPLKSLNKIASGGELSRIILAFKSVLAQNDNINTMIFDEIDAGIGGRTALSVSKALKKLGNQKQLICITHLAQIAAAGSSNFLIHKEVGNEKTVTLIKKLDEQTRVAEISRMLSGENTDTSMTHAKELIALLNK
ncbi:MAG: DNA repair protein RecN [Spirochaetes bacterium]|nr:DNA repair protein RecN [Spirochaetota bacterium]